jgi:hypothetical protein
MPLAEEFPIAAGLLSTEVAGFTVGHLLLEGAVIVGGAALIIAGARKAISLALGN